MLVIFVFIIVLATAKVDFDSEHGHVYNGFLYRTLNGFKRLGEPTECDDKLTPISAGWNIAPAQPDIVDNVVAPYPWSTRRLVFKNGDAYGTSACVPGSICASDEESGFVGKLWKTDQLQESDGKYRVKACSLAILIRIQVVDPVHQFVYDGFIYRTMNNGYRMVYDKKCDKKRGYTAVPIGWEIAPEQADIVKHVVAPFPWNAHRLVFSNGTVYGSMCCVPNSSCARGDPNGFVGKKQFSDRGGELVTSPIKSNPPKYTTGGCSMAILIRRSLDDQVEVPPSAESVVCQNGGTGVGQTCDCKPGFTGELCQHDIDECIDGTHNCPAETTCQNLAGSYKCEPIPVADCKNGGTPEGQTCHCQPGYTGLLCEHDIDECLDGNHTCPADTTCKNLPGSYSCEPCQNGGSASADGLTCECQDGFNGDHCEHDIDECATGRHNCADNQLCKNLVGSFKCEACQNGGMAAADGSKCDCPSGFNGDHCEHDIDECTSGTHNCPADTVCKNVIGGFICEAIAPPVKKQVTPPDTTDETPVEKEAPAEATEAAGETATKQSASFWIFLVSGGLASAVGSYAVYLYFCKRVFSGLGPLEAPRGPRTDMRYHRKNSVNATLELGAQDEKLPLELNAVAVESA